MAAGCGREGHPRDCDAWSACQNLDHTHQQHTTTGTPTMRMTTAATYVPPMRVTTKWHVPSHMHTTAPPMRVTTKWHRPSHMHTTAPPNLRVHVTVTQELSFTGISEEDAKSNSDAITSDIALSLGVAQSDVSIISITEVDQRRRRRLLAKKLIIVYEVIVADATSASVLTSKMESPTFANELKSKVSTATGKAVTVTPRAPSVKITSSVPQDVTTQWHIPTHTHTTAAPNEHGGDSSRFCGAGTKMVNGKCIVAYSNMREMCEMAKHNDWGWDCQQLSQCAAP